MPRSRRPASPLRTLRAAVALGIAALLAEGAAAPAAHAQAPARPAAAGATLAQRLGHPANAKLLILHADDLGVAHSVDTASLDALERGVISSASVMMPTPWVTEVAAWARAHPDHDLGLHLTITSEWKSYRWGPLAPVNLVPSLLDSAGTLVSATAAVTARAALAEVERELRAQVDRAVAVGLRPTHLDSHMGALYNSPGLYATLARVAKAYGLPFMVTRAGNAMLPPELRADPLAVLDTVITIGPEVPADRWRSFYLDAIRNLKPGLSEMLVHLGRDDAELRAVTVDHPDWGSAWRQRDDDVLRSAEFRQALRDNGVVLVRWRDVRRAMGGA